MSSSASDDRAFIERSVRFAIVAATALGVVIGALWLLKGALHSRWRSWSRTSSIR